MAVFDELSDLRLFTHIVGAGSLSEAARRSNASLTSVSRRLARYEEKLGVRLIDRGSRKFMLTEEGILLHRRALPILQMLDLATTEVGSLAGEAKGRIRVSAPNEIGRRQISRLCKKFTDLFPSVTVELTLTDARPDILKNELDIALQTKRPTDGDVIHRKILSSRRVVCASPEYLAHNHAPQRPEDLKQHRCIRMQRGRVLYGRWTLRGAESPNEIVVDGTLVSNSGETIHEWVLEGAGVAVKALWDIEEDLNHGKLVELLGEHACDDMNLYATHFNRRLVPPRLRFFIDFLAEQLPRASRIAV